ncbi:MAG TPA: universal stress protein [Acidimicrobiales bacterium]
MPTLTFGDDLSPSGDLAFSWIDHQRWDGWRLEVLHAEAPPFGPPVPAEESEPHPWSPERPRVPSPSAGFGEVVHLLAKADPRLALLRPTDLLVIGPRGRGLLKTLHLGSVAEWLLVHPTSPMVIAKTDDTVRDVLVAHDGSPSAARAVRALCATQWARDAKVTVVVVADGRVDPDRAADAARSALHDVSVEPEVVTHTGAATAVIAREIDQRHPQLVVLGTRGLSGLRRLHLGSTAGAIARTVRCSVLVACADDDANMP